MSRNGDEAASRAGHGLNTSTLSRPSLIIKLSIPSLRNGSTAHSSTNLHGASGFAAPAALPVLPPPNVPKRRGRPPKNQPRPDNYAPPPKPKVSDLPKPLATRSSKRKAAEMSGEPGAAGSVTGDADDDDFDGHQPPRKKSRSASVAPPMRISTRNRGRRHSNAESAIANAEAVEEITNGHVTPVASLHKESSQSEREIQVIRTSSRARKHENWSSSNELMASIEPHERLEKESGALGVTTRAGARTRSTSTKPHAATQDDDAIPSAPAAGEVADAVNGEDETVQSNAGTLIRPRGRGRWPPNGAVNGEVETVQSDAGTPIRPRGRGRWPNGAVKAKVMAAALSKKAASKKKGAPGKRKTSDDALVQAVYDRQAHLRSSYKDLRKIIIRAEQALLDRALEELEEDPDRHKKTPYYDNVMRGLDARHTKVMAQNERKDRLNRELLNREFEANVAMTWQQHNVSFLVVVTHDQSTNSRQLEVKELQEKYEMICKRAIMDILKQAGRDDDDAATVTEVCVFYYCGFVTLLTKLD